MTTRRRWVPATPPDARRRRRPTPARGTGTRATRVARRRRARRRRLAGRLRARVLAGRPRPGRVGAHPLRPRAVGVAGLPGVRRHRRGRRRCYLFGKRHSLGWDRLAGASAEVGVLFMGITLVTGMLWGRLTWGVFWEWDARLTTTAFLFVTYVGYLAVRRLGGSHEQRARRSAVLALLAVLEIPLVHFSVRLWRSLHQEATVLRPDGDVKMDGLMLFTLFVGIVAFTLLYVWLVIHRQRTLAAEDALDDAGLDLALAARRAESGRPSRGASDGGRRVHHRQLRRHVRRHRRLRLVACCAGPAARRPQLPDEAKPVDLSRDADDLDLSPRPPRRGAARRRGRRVGAARRARARARRRRRARHPVPALGRRLLLQRRRDRRARDGCEPGRRLRVQGTVDAGTVDTGRRRHHVHDLVQRRHACRCATTAQPGGIFEECQPVVVHGELVGTARSRATGSRSSTPTSTWPRTPTASTGPAAAESADVLAASLNGALGRAGLMLDAGRGRVRRAGHGLRHAPRRPAAAAHGAALRLARASAGAVLAVVMMQRALITRDFSLAYVQQVGSSTTPPLYNIAAMWSALEGSILLWVVDPRRVHRRRRVALPPAHRRPARRLGAGRDVRRDGVLRPAQLRPGRPVRARPPCRPARRPRPQPAAAEPRPRAVPPADPVPRLRRLHRAVRLRHRRPRHRPGRRGLADGDPPLGAVLVGASSRSASCSAAGGATRCSAGAACGRGTRSRTPASCRG